MKWFFYEVKEPKTHSYSVNVVLKIDFLIFGHFMGL
jgi:hypothetical protein